MADKNVNEILNKFWSNLSPEKRPPEYNKNNSDNFINWFNEVVKGGVK